MKEIVKFDKEITTDVHASGGLVVADGFLTAKAEVKYPLVKIVEPVTKVIESGLDKLEALIPGDWDKSIVENLKKEMREEIAKVLSDV